MLPCFAGRAPRRGRCRAGVRSPGRAGFNAESIGPAGGGGADPLRPGGRAGGGNRRRRAGRGDGMLETAPAADTTDELLRKVLVAEALQSLSPAHREVLNETVLRDRTVNEAAEALGIPVGTVKSRVYYALKALRVVLAERGVAA